MSLETVCDDLPSVPAPGGGRRANVSACRSGPSQTTSRSRRHTSSCTLASLATPPSVGGTQLDSCTDTSSPLESTLMETGSVAGTLVDSQESNPPVPLVLPHTMDIHARVEGEHFGVYTDATFDTRLLSLSRNQTLVMFTDGSYDAREGKAGWGAVAVHRDGGLKGPLEDEGDSKRVLRGPVVINPLQAGYLQNTSQKLSNGTAELSAIAEAILYLLELLRDGGRDAGRVKLVVIRTDSTYAEGAIRGRTQARENKRMVYEIRRHYAALKQRLQALNIHLAWSHVSAHVGKRWNEFADNTAKEGATGKRPISRSTFRNPQLGGPIADPSDEEVAESDCESDDGVDTVVESQPDRSPPPVPVAPCDEGPPDDAWNRPTDDTPLLDIPMSDLGVLCGLVSTKNYVRHKWRNTIRRCYLFLFRQLMEGDNMVSNALLWKKILLLQRVLFTPLAPGVNWSFMARCERVLRDDWSHFTLGVFKKRGFSPPGGRSVEQHTKAKLSRSRALMGAGEIARSFRCLQSEYVEPRSPEELRDAYLQKLAKRSDDCNIPTASNVPDIVISVETAAKVVKEASLCISNCSITCTRFEVFQALIGKGTTPDEIEFLSHLTAFFNAIVQNKVPAEVEPLLTGTQGLIIPKQDGKDRPLGLREGLTNLATKCAVRTVRPKLNRIFTGKNYALAGSNKISELIALSTNHLRASPEHDNVFIDVPNAFNESSREEAARNIIARCPELLRLFELLYRDASHIWLRDVNDDWLSSLASEGCVQGCVLGPLVFGFATLSLYESVMRTLEGKENAFFGAFSDDSMIGAAHDDALHAFDTFEREAQAIRLKVNFNRNKTVVMIGRCGSQAELDRRVQAYQERGFPESNILVHPDDGGDPLLYGYKHLGVPVGSRQYCSSALDALIDKFVATCECDDEVESVQQKWVYLLWVIRHKFPYWFRHMCPSITVDKLPAINRLLKSKFSAIAGFELDVTENVWKQVCLPIKSHGCGLGDPYDVITAAFAAHVDETFSEVKQHFPNAAYLDLLHSDDDIDDDWQFESPDIKQFVLGYRKLKRRILDSQASLGQEYDEEHAAEMVVKKKAQHFYFTFLTEHAVKEYEDGVMLSGSLHDRARTFSNDGSFAGAWLHGIPKKDNRHLDNVTFRRALMLRLGVPFADKPLRCKCKNRAIIDSHLDHILSCSQFSAERKHRHDAIVQDIKSMCNHAGLQFTDSRLGELRTPTHNDNKAADGCIRGLGPKPLDIDVTVWNPTGVTALRRGSGATQHQTISDAEKMKTDKYEERCRQIDHKFMPMAIEIYGAVSKQVESFIGKVVERAAEVNAIPQSILLSYWKKRISTTLQHYNARLINQAYLQLNDYGGGNMYRDFALDRVG